MKTIKKDELEFLHVLGLSQAGSGYLVPTR